MKPITRFLIGALLMCVVIGFGCWKFRTELSPVILETHTHSIFNQFKARYDAHLAEGGSKVSSEADWLALVSLWEIDWNSCRLHQGRILDGWGTPVELRVGQITISLRSAGRDQTFGTKDDILKEF